MRADDGQRRLLQQMAIGRSSGRFPLTIGELFPDGDLVAQWVFSVTSLAEDLMILLPLTSSALREQDLRAMLFHQRQLVIKVYEAWRLIDAAERNSEIAEFSADLLDMKGHVDLRRVYRRDPETGTSVVSELFRDIRNRSVHYMWIGRSELRDILWRHSGAPAAIDLSAREDQTHVWFQWVTLVQMSDLLGDVGSSELFDVLVRRIQTATAIATTWLIVASIALFSHSMRLGIDSERLGRSDR